MKQVTVDHKVTRFCREFLSDITFGWLVAKPKYLDASTLSWKLNTHRLSTSQTQISTTTVDINENLKGLAVIALRQELSTASNPEDVLKKYTPAVRHQVCSAFISHFDGKSYGSDVSRRLDKTFTNYEDLEEALLKNFYNMGANFETGKRDIEKVADRLMNTETAKRKDAVFQLSDSLAQSLLRNIQHTSGYKGTFNKMLAKGIDPKPQAVLKWLLDENVDLKTGKTRK